MVIDFYVGVAVFGMIFQIVHSRWNKNRTLVQLKDMAIATFGLFSFGFILGLRMV